MKLRVGVAALVLSLTLVAGGYSRGDADSIKIGALFDLTGPTSDIGTGYSQGIRDYVEWVNGKGGIKGSKIDLIWQDYAYNVARAEQIYSQFRQSGVVAIFGWGTPDTEALRGRINQDKIPYVSASYAATLVDPSKTPYNFVPGVNYSAQLQIVLKWIAKRDSGKRVQVAVFHHNSPFGRAPLSEGAEYIKQKNLNIDLKTYTMQTGATDYTAQLTQARDADYVVIQNVPTPAALLAKNVRSLGMNAKIVCLNYCGDEVLVSLAGTAARGVFAVQPFAPLNLTVPGMADPRAFLKKKNRSLAKTHLHYVQGWYHAAVLAAGIKKVLDSGKELSGPNVKEGLETMAPLLSGKVAVPIKFSSSSHDGMSGARLYVVTAKGTFAKATGFIVP